MLSAPCTILKENSIKLQLVYLQRPNRYVTYLNTKSVAGKGADDACRVRGSGPCWFLPLYYWVGRTCAGLPSLYVIVSYGCGIEEKTNTGIFGPLSINGRIQNFSMVPILLYIIIASFWFSFPWHRFSFVSFSQPNDNLHGIGRWWVISVILYNDIITCCIDAKDLPPPSSCYWG